MHTLWPGSIISAVLVGGNLRGCRVIQWLRDVGCRRGFLPSFQEAWRFLRTNMFFVDMKRFWWGYDGLAAAVANAVLPSMQRWSELDSCNISMVSPIQSKLSIIKIFDCRLKIQMCSVWSEVRLNSQITFDFRLGSLRKLRPDKALKCDYCSFSRCRLQAGLLDWCIESELNRRVAADMSVSLSRSSFQNHSHCHAFKQHRNRYNIVVINGNLDFVQRPK